MNGLMFTLFLLKYIIATKYANALYCNNYSMYSN